MNTFRYGSDEKSFVCLSPEWCILHRGGAESTDDLLLHYLGALYIYIHILDNVIYRSLSWDLTSYERHKFFFGLFYGGNEGEVFEDVM